MITRYRHFIRALVFLTACLLVSCIDGREEYWLNADGSGRADFSYSFPASAAKFQGGADGLRKMIGDFLTSSPDIKSPVGEVTAVGDRLNVHVAGAFDSAKDLATISPPGETKTIPPVVSKLAGDFLVNMHGRHVELSRTVSPGLAIPGAVFMSPSKFADHNLVYILHLPISSDANNATRVEDDGKTLIWEFPLAQAVRKPVVIQFKGTIPIPRSWIAGACGLGLLVIAFAGFGVLKWRKRRSAITCSGVSMSAGDS